MLVWYLVPATDARSSMAPTRTFPSAAAWLISAAEAKSKSQVVKRPSISDLATADTGTKREIGSIVVIALSFDLWTFHICW
jgi:hypothetical protein